MPPWLSHAPPTTGRTPPPAHTTTSSSKAFATSSSNDGTATGSEGHHSDPDDPRNYRMPLKRGRETPNNGLDNHWGENNGRSAIDTARASPLTGPPRSRSRPSSSSSATAASANNAALLAAAQAAGMPLSALDPSDPMSSMNALLAAAQVSFLGISSNLMKVITISHVLHSEYLRTKLNRLFSLLDAQIMLMLMLHNAIAMQLLSMLLNAHVKQCLCQVIVLLDNADIYDRLMVQNIKQCETILNNANMNF